MKQLHESKDCTHGFKGMRYKLGKIEYTACPLCKIPQSVYSCSFCEEQFAVLPELMKHNKDAHNGARI